MTITDYAFIVICALLFGAIIAAYIEVNRMCDLVYRYDKQREIDRQRIARYEISIQSLPPECRNRILNKINASTKKL